MGGRRFWLVFCLSLFAGAMFAGDSSAGPLGGWREKREDRKAARQERREQRRNPDAAESSLPGMQAVAINAGGASRNYLLYVPKSYAPGAAAPLVLVFHGGGANAEKMASHTGFAELADKEGFIVAFPNGVTGGLGGGTWNTGSGKGMGKAEKRNVDDLGFTRAMLTQIKSKYSIDPKRIYATGVSKGGMFAYYLACNMSDQIAAIAPVSATMVNPRCDPKQPVAVLHIHGTADQNVPLEGGRGDMTGAGYTYPAVARTIDFWTSRDKCGAAESESRVGADTTCRKYASCTRDVTLCLIEGGGHGWPGKPALGWQQKRNVYITQSFDATGEAWNFFRTHPKP